MATWYFTVHGGDFKEGKGSYSEGLLSKSFQFPGFALPWQGKYSNNDVEAVEFVTDEMAEDGTSKGGLAAAGFLFFGLPGAVLGSLVGGKQKREATFVVRFTDGKSFLGSSNLATFQKLKALSLRIKKKTLEQGSKNLADLQTQEHNRKATLDALQEADAAIAEEKRLEQQQAEDVAIAQENEQKRELERQESQAADAAIAKQKKLRNLSVEIKDASKVLTKCLDAWQQAGSPEIQQEALDKAKEKANGLLILLRNVNGNHRITAFKIGYLRLAYFTRKTTGQLGMPWFLATIIMGAIFFTFASLGALLVTNSLVVNFVFGGTAFLSGFVATFCLLFLPENVVAGKQIAFLRQQKSNQVESLQAAELAYEEAQQEYNRLASLRQLRTDCENASLKKLRLQEEYQATFDE